MTDQPMAREVCDHSWAWVSPAGSRNAARICMTCHEPSSEWLNKIWDQLSEHNEGEIMCGCQSEHPGCVCGGLACYCHRARTSRDYLRSRNGNDNTNMYLSISFPNIPVHMVRRIIAGATAAAGPTVSYNVFIEDSPVDDDSDG